MKLLSKLKIPFIKSASNGDFDKKDETSQNGGEDSKGRFRDSKARFREGANKRGNSSRLTQSFHFFMFEPIFSPVNALNQPI
ncbi:hypothetical protein [Enterobacter cloacae]|uniref:hypothetical protein n=1 Tax=Enterobacter cloacae TaxID=550 RepID=UPI001F4FFF49|nr:hypothetical protein [Enterobacter cloacae]